MLSQNCTSHRNVEQTSPPSLLSSLSTSSHPSSVVFSPEPAYRFDVLPARRPHRLPWGLSEESQGAWRTRQGAVGYLCRPGEEVTSPSQRWPITQVPLQKWWAVKCPKIRKDLTSLPKMFLFGCYILFLFIPFFILLYLIFFFLIVILSAMSGLSFLLYSTVYLFKEKYFCSEPKYLYFLALDSLRMPAAVSLPIPHKLARCLNRKGCWHLYCTLVSPIVDTLWKQSCCFWKYSR